MTSLSDNVVCLMRRAHARFTSDRAYCPQMTLVCRTTVHDSVLGSNYRHGRTRTDTPPPHNTIMINLLASGGGVRLGETEGLWTVRERLRRDYGETMESERDYGERIC